MLSFLISLVIMFCIFFTFHYFYNYRANKILKYFNIDKKDANKFGSALAFAMQDAGVLMEYQNKSIKEKYSWSYNNKDFILKRLNNPSR